LLCIALFSGRAYYGVWAGTQVLGVVGWGWGVRRWLFREYTGPAYDHLKRMNRNNPLIRMF
jgi:hypothetical protein